MNANCTYHGYCKFGSTKSWSKFWYFFFRILHFNPCSDETGTLLEKTVNAMVVSHYNDAIMSAMGPRSPASRLFTQPFIQAQTKKASKLLVTGLCAGNSRVTGEFPAQRASNAENVNISWLHHGALSPCVAKLLSPMVLNMRDESVRRNKWLHLPSPSVENADISHISKKVVSLEKA